MYLTLPAGTVFYRVTPWRLKWPDVLTGLGAYYGGKKYGRYHGPRQRTVYTAIDPLVVVTEAAFYAALDWQEKIGTTVLPKQHHLPPLVYADYKLWSFRLDPPPAVIDLEDPIAVQVFGHPAFVLRNPTNTHYLPTQDLIDAVFGHPANPQGLKAWGVRAPSVRTPALPAYQPHQFIFILQPQQKRLPAHLIDCWRLEFEFLDFNRQPVTAHATLVNWQQPRFRLIRHNGLTAAAGLPAFGARPNAVAYPPDQWHPVTVAYA